jgi:hypothetical protein
MSSRKRSRTRRLVARVVSPGSRAAAWCRGRLMHSGRTVARWLRPWRPVVAADVSGKRGRRLRKEIGRVTRSHFRALGVTPPGHLLVVVQRTVVEQDRPLAALLLAFEDGDGHRRHLLFLALSAGGEQVSDEGVLATLRQQLQRVVAGELGTLRLSVPLEPARAQMPVAVVPLRLEQQPPPFDEEAPPPEEPFESWDGIAAAAATEA